MAKTVGPSARKPSPMDHRSRMSPGVSSYQFSGAHVAPLSTHPHTVHTLFRGRSNLSLALGIVYETKVFEAQRPSPLSVRKTVQARHIAGSQTHRP